MRQGIVDAATFILFLSAGVLTRPFCQFEIRAAVALKKRMILIRELAACAQSVADVPDPIMYVWCL